LTNLAAEPAARHWHPVARSVDLSPGARVRTVLLGDRVIAWRDPGGEPRASGPDGGMLRLRDAYGLVWANLVPGEAEPPEYPAYADARYQHALCGPYGVRTSAPRIIENFLDMGHFPFVHDGILGERPRTEVADYKVHAPRLGHGPAASECVFWQPGASMLKHAGARVFYAYDVPRPFCAVLAKQPDAEGGQGVAILLAVQPALPERSIAWMVFSTTNLEPDEKTLRARQEQVFMQDKPILENQLPGRLPLGTRDEVAVPCDRLSLAYRRYLDQQRIGFGVIQA
jgi:phenylpropionate dioxygenase-like ring-hydroxylating dioxygenase large terminal subunit